MWRGRFVKALIMLGWCQPRMPQLQWLPRVDAAHERCWRTFPGGLPPREGGQGGQGWGGVRVALVKAAGEGRASLDCSCFAAVEALLLLLRTLLPPTFQTVISLDNKSFLGKGKTVCHISSCLICLCYLLWQPPYSFPGTATQWVVVYSCRVQGIRGLIKVRNWQKKQLSGQIQIQAPQKRLSGNATHVVSKESEG